jgi:2-polyprenyl-6-methoxyphenol hydroxylase-like FAD-dependent oxidoreductase
MNGSTHLRVAVVGCGIGGPAAALFLARAGHEVTVYDRAEELGPKGAGVLLAPTGQYVLDRLGLLRSALDHGSRIQRLIGYRGGSHKVMDLRYHHLGTGLFGLGIHRGTLFTILWNAMKLEKIEVVTGRQITGVRAGYVSDAEGRQDGPYDLVVIADGAKSAIRDSLSLGTKCTPYGYGAVWASVTNWGDFPDNVLRQSFRGTRRMMGLLPSGNLDHGDGRQISIFWSLPLCELDQWKSDGLDHWKYEAAKLMPGTEVLLEQIEAQDQVTIASYFDVRTRSNVVEECVVIGDADHASSPHLGQGASLALFDAMILARCLQEDPNVTAALMSFRDLRRAHIRFYQRTSKLMTPLFQSSHSYLAVPRDLLLGPLCKLPWVQREMVATMCGLKDGVFGRIPQIDSIMHLAAKFAFGARHEDDVEATVSTGRP